MVDGKPEPVSGEKRNFSGMAYIDGRVMSLAEYNKRFPKDRQTKESQLRAHGRASDWLVELRTGGFLQFFPEQGDTSIPLQNRTDE
jgi:hypothetical protein